MNLVVCKIPKAGLGNQLFPLMKAQVFAHLNNLPIIITGYHQLKIGPYLRSEKSKRKYLGFFLFEKNILLNFFDKRKLLFYNSKNRIEEPVLNTNYKQNTSIKEGYFFSKVPHWDNYFGGLREHRKLVNELLWSLIKPALHKQINALTPPCIGVHIRMGDFRKLKPDEDFGTVGAVRTPEAYFVKTIQAIRELNGTDLPVCIFSDGFREELQQILSLPNTILIEGNNDLVDLLLLSKSRLIITSAGSTFSYWASFLSEGIIIQHPDHPLNIRKIEHVVLPYEGVFDSANTTLTDNIKQIQIHE